MTPHSLSRLSWLHSQCAASKGKRRFRSVAVVNPICPKESTLTFDLCPARLLAFGVRIANRAYRPYVTLDRRDAECKIELVGSAGAHAGYRHLPSVLPDSNVLGCACR
jgi:hypothetical protein